MDPVALAVGPCVWLSHGSTDLDHLGSYFDPLLLGCDVDLDAGPGSRVGHVALGLVGPRLEVEAGKEGIGGPPMDPGLVGPSQ